MMDPLGRQPMPTSRVASVDVDPAPGAAQVSGCAMPEPVPVRPNERELLWKKHEEQVFFFAWVCDV